MISCRNVSHRYGKQTVLSEVTFEIEPGEWKYIFGPSGSGKTTLLRSIAGLLRPAQGEIIHGEALTGKIAMTFQEPSLWPHLNALGNVLYPMRPNGRSKSELRERALSLLEKLGVGEKQNRFPDQLSGGEARRVELARALAVEPKLLLLDEPAAHLDIQLQHDTITAVRQIACEINCSTLCVTHQPIATTFVSNDRCLLLIDGRVTYDGLITEISRAPDHSYTNTLRRYLN